MAEEEKTRKLYPMVFKAIDEAHSWGEESYKIADLGIYDTEAAEGWLGENTIDEIMETYMDRVVGDFVFSYTGRQFPVMVKTIKAVGRTPLLACPDDVIASQRYDSLGKAKLWYIADAAPMSKVYVGFKEEISAERLYTGCMDGSIISSLNAVTPHVGDHFFISPGVVHCAEGGVTIVEVAESSPLDFTLTDWGEAKDSKAQVKGDGMEDMGIVAAMDFLAMKPVSQPAPAEARPEDGDAENLAKCNQFTVNKIHLHDAIHVVADRFDSFIVYYCLAGSATLQTEEVEDGKKHMAAYQLKAGEAMLVPAECEDFFLVPRDRDTVVIEVMQEPREEDDEYINKAAEAHIPGEDYDTEETEDDRLDYEIRHQSLNNIKFKN